MRFQLETWRFPILASSYFFFPHADQIQVNDVESPQIPLYNVDSHQIYLKYTNLYRYPPHCVQWS